MPPNTLSRKQRERIRHKNEILNAALKLFSEKGFHNVSMQEIAKEAEFAIGTLYKFFDTKEDLYKSLVLRLAETFHDRLSSVLESRESEIRKLRDFIVAKGELFSENLPTIRLYFAEARGASSDTKTDLNARLWKSRDEVLQKLARVFRNGLRKGIFNDLADPYSLAVAFDSLSNGFLFLWLKNPDKHPYPDKLDVIMNIFFNQLVANKEAALDGFKDKKKPVRKEAS
ncbi:MAG: TetR/AcrR family transcriptional regulator [Deltaproteobacteria bacterium]|nr:MAG: TetR/AcrR family transcriptional regulator [Deltaproteobacteria bacterium]